MVNLIPNRLLKAGRVSSTISNPSINAKKLTRIDSERNCEINLFFPEPTTFRRPTSLALVADLAVARFIKLIQAIKRIRTATTEKM